LWEGLSRAPRLRESDGGQVAAIHILFWIATRRFALKAETREWRDAIHEHFKANRYPPQADAIGHWNRDLNRF
jgi:hypothetical protein